MVVVTALGPPEDGIRLTQAGTSAFIDTRPVGKGTLYISESRLTWVGDSGHTFSLEYPHITMHAISKDVTAFPHSECLYLMIDVRLDDPEGPAVAEEMADSDEEEESQPEMTEIRFVPEDKSKLDLMFQEMSHCQSLHPDPPVDGEDDDDSFEEGDGEDIYEDAEEDLPQDNGDTMDE